MNNDTLRMAQSRLYLRLVQEVVKVVANLLGSPLDRSAREHLATRTFPLVDRVRGLTADNVYRDYQDLVDNPVPQPQMSRFTLDLWQGVVDKTTEEAQFVTVAVSEDLGMKADYWARDAEWGERVQIAKADDRVGRIARVDYQPPTCPLCTLMNSRGPVYTHDGFLRTLHDGDTCVSIFVLKGQEDYPGKSHTEEALRRYNQAVLAAAPSRGANAIMAEMKRQFPYDGVGVVRATAQNTAQKAGDKQIKDARKALSSLQKTNPSTESGKKLREEKISRITELLKVRETNNG